MTQLWYLHKHTMHSMQVHLTDQIWSIKAQCNAVYPKICFRKCSHFSPRGGKIQKMFWGRIPQTPLPVHTISHQTFCHQQPSVIHSSLHTQYSMVPFCRCPPPRQVLKKSPVFKSFRCMKTGHGLGFCMAGQMLHCSSNTLNIYFYS